MKFDAYQMVTDRICALLEQGIKPWAKPWVGSECTAWSGSNGKPYSILNQMLLADPEKKYTSLEELLNDIRGEWITYKQAQDRGGSVRKGEHGRRIVFFKSLEIKDEDDEEKDPKIVPYLTSYTVFRVDQCDGVEQKYHLDGELTFDFTGDDSADEVANGYITREGITFKMVKGDRAFYRPSEDLVVLPMKEQFQSSEEYYSTLFHELTHSTGHPKRLNRINTMAAFGDDYSREELVAEIGSASICATLGLETKGSFSNSAAYIGNWLEALRNDKKMIVWAASRAEKAVQMILNIYGE